MYLSSYNWERFLDENSELFYPTRNTLKEKIKEDENNVVVELELPRFRKEDIKVSFKNQILIVEAKKADDQNKLYQEWIINRDVDGNKIEAKLEYGVLTVTLPLKTEPGNTIVVQ